MVDPLCPGGPRTVAITQTWGSITLTLLDEDNGGHEYTLADVVGALVRPALQASGYSPKAVAEHVPEVYC